MITSINWKMTSHMTMAREGRGLYRDEELKVQLEVITPRNQHGDWGTGKTFYFIDGDTREFLTEEALIEAYNEKFQFDGEQPKQLLK